MRTVLFTAALAALLATAAACGGDSEDARQERLHPVLHDVTYQQAQEGQEYILLWGDFSNLHLSNRINASTRWAMKSGTPRETDSTTLSSSSGRSATPKSHRPRTAKLRELEQKYARIADDTQMIPSNCKHRIIHLDHKNPKSLPGFTHTIENRAPMCPHHNIHKDNKRIHLDE